MFPRLSIIASLAILMTFLALNVAAATLAESGQTVRTVLVFESPGYGVEGQLRATFRATTTGDGTWNVEATFRPHGLKLLLFNQFGQPWMWVPVRGVGSATTPATTGEPVQIVAMGLYFIHPNSGRHDRPVQCTFTVGADGVVTVQFIWV